MPIIGTETEYGITAPALPGADPELLSALVVDHFPGAATPVLAEVHNRTLGNGARLYVDHGHPEYCTPEASSAIGAAIADRAGELVMARAAAAASERLGERIRLYKNCTDGKGRSYGHHENYLVARELPWSTLETALPTFLVTRTTFAGAGRVGLGQASERAGFQLSQRADFFERVSGLDTTANRGILNTRDEPHATASRWRRLHVIPGDATRNPFATWLRLGATSLVLAALEAGWTPPRRLADPVAAFRAVSRDLTLTAPLPLADGGAATAVELQRDWLAGASAVVAPDDDQASVLAEWAQVLEDLDGDASQTADRLDWTAKLGLLDAARRRGALRWDAPRLAQLDLAWADLDDAASPYAALRRSGVLADWVSDAEAVAAASTPPSDTRAYARGRLVAEYPDAVIAATWESVLLRDASGGLHNLRMGDPWSHARGDFERVLATLPPLARA